jgi:hypothetical protein
MPLLGVGHRPIHHRHRHCVGEEQFDPESEGPSPHLRQHVVDKLAVDGVEGFNDVEQRHRPPFAQGEGELQQQHEQPDAVPDAPAWEEPRLLRANHPTQGGGETVAEHLAQQLVVCVEEGERAVVGEAGGIPLFVLDGERPRQEPSGDTASAADGCEQAGEQWDQHPPGALSWRQAALGRVS